jgi:hypothetical protein
MVGRLRVRRSGAGRHDRTHTGSEHPRSLAVRCAARSDVSAPQASGRKGRRQCRATASARSRIQPAAFCRIPRRALTGTRIARTGRSQHLVDQLPGGRDARYREQVHDIRNRRPLRITSPPSRVAIAAPRLATCAPRVQIRRASSRRYPSQPTPLRARTFAGMSQTNSPCKIEGLGTFTQARLPFLNSMPAPPTR